MKSTDIFPKRLADAREMRKLNQAELAQRSGMQASAISHFETGSRKPSFDNLRRLADALDVTSDYLIGRTDRPNEHSQTGDRLHRHIEKLSAADIDLADKILESLAQRSEKEK